jgi:hypothetical protein
LSTRPIGGKSNKITFGNLLSSFNVLDSKDGCYIKSNTYAISTVENLFY